MIRGPIMMIAGEPSGDTLAAELVGSLRSLWPGALPELIGAGGPRMRQAGVDLSHELTTLSVIGPADVARHYFHFRRIFHDLVRRATERRPELIVLVDYSHFNHRFASAIREVAARTGGAWKPKLVKYVSPQVWASRPGRAKVMERDFDLLLCLFPFEPGWYASRTPRLRVRYVGHPVLDRYPASSGSPTPHAVSGVHRVLLLPGSRRQELQRHLPVMQAACVRLAAGGRCEFLMVLPTEALREQAAGLLDPQLAARLQVGGLPEALKWASVAIASTGSVTMDCAYFSVPTVALYRTALLTYLLGKRLVTVPYLAMPNLLAGRVVMPEFVQGDATAEAIAGAASEILQKPERAEAMREGLRGVIRSLGDPGASGRAAAAILELVSLQEGVPQPQLS